MAEGSRDGGTLDWPALDWGDEPALDLALIERVRAALAPYHLETAISLSEPLSARCGRPVYLKHENQQRTGSFKVRGALARLTALEGETRRRGVVAASAGNHALGIAFAARSLGILALVVVPETVAQVKLRKLSEMMVKVRVLGRNYDEAELAARELAREAEATFVSPFDDPWVMAGNGGTLGLELRAQLPELGGVVVPVGGGGLAAGLGVALEGVPVLGVNSEASPAMARSLADGRVYETWPSAPTLAEGLEGGVSARSVALCARYVERVEVVSEHAIAAALRFMAHEHKIVLEGSAAAGVAALRTGVELPGSGPLVVVLTGRNIDPARLKQVLTSG